MPKLAFVVTAETEEAAARIREFAANSGASLGSLETKGKSSFTELNSAVALAKQGIEAMKQVWDFAKQGAENERIAQSFEATAASVGVSADAMAQALDKAAKGTVDDEIFMQTATRNMALGVATSVQENVALMELARGASVKFGGDTETAFAGISEAIGNLQTRQLKQYGIIIDAKKVNEDYAKAIGKTADALTDAEQREALRNEVLKQSSKLMGDAGSAALTSAEKFKKFETQAGNLIDGLKEFAVNALTPVLDRTDAFATLSNDAASAQDKLAAATRINGDALSGMTGKLDPLIEKLRIQIELEERLGMTSQESALRSNMAKVSTLEVTRAAGDETVTAILAEEEAMKRAAEAADASEAATRRNADALRAQNAAAIDTVNSFYGLASGLNSSKDPIDITKEALRGLQQMAGENELTAGRLQSALYSAGLASGLVTKESLAQAGAIEKLNQLYATGAILPEEYATGLKKIPDAAKDGVVTMEELGVKTAGALKKTKQDLLDEMGNAITGTESEVSRAVDQSMRAVSTAASTAKSLVKGVGDAIGAIPEVKYVDIYIRTHGEVPDLGGDTGTTTGGGTGKTGKSSTQSSGMRIVDDLGSQVRQALNSGMAMAGV